MALVTLPVFADGGVSGAYSPYSVYGIGTFVQSSSARDMAMAGVGIASRNRSFIGVQNPASVTARDTLSFMSDFSLYSSNKLFRQGGLSSADNAVSIGSMNVSFPLWKKSAFFAGISPFSETAYEFSHSETDPQIVGITDNIDYSDYGSGNLYQIYYGLGMSFGRRLSAGIQAIHYFGNLEKAHETVFASSSHRHLYNGSTMNLRAFTGKLGLQWEQPVSDDSKLSLGATYRFGTKLGGTVTNYNYAVISAMTDTIGYASGPCRGVKMAGELGLGVAYKKGNKLTAELDWLYSDWSRSGFDSTEGFANKGKAVFSATASNSIRAGVEYIPNQNDIRYYFRRCTYRGGLYYGNEYYRIDGNAVNSFGLTLGMTLPVFRWHNGISIGVDMGQKGSLRGLMTRERYCKFMVSFNIHDIWFQKPRYE